MSKTLLAGVMLAALATAGVMYANRPGDEPNPSEPRKPGAIAEPIAAAVAEPKGEEKGYTRNPRMRRAADLRIGSLQAVAWRPDGKKLAVAGQVSSQSRVPQGPAQGRGAVLVVTEAAEKGFDTVRVDTGNDQLIGYAPDGKHLLTELCEHGLVSGFHRLRYWGDAMPLPQPNPKPGAEGFGVLEPAPESELVKTVELDTGITTGCRFAADGKSFRTLRLEPTDDGKGFIKRVEVVEVDAEKGTTRRSRLTVEGVICAFDLGANGRLLALLDDDDKVSVYDVDAGKNLWSTPGKLTNAELIQQQNRMGTVIVSPDGHRVIAARGIGTPAVFEAANGRRLPTLEGNGMLESLAGPGCFSSDGRLLALGGDRYELIPRNNPFGRPSTLEAVAKFLTVWDTETGKVVKSWHGSPITVAFHPSKPVLAIFEQNGDSRTRLGLWDFSAEAANK